MLAVSNRHTKIQPWILHPQVQEYVGSILIQIKDLHGWTDCIHCFISVAMQTKKMHLEPKGAIVGDSLLVRENAAYGRIDTVCLVNNQVDPHQNLKWFGCHN